VDVIFYLRSDGQYVLISDAIIALLFFISILCEVLIDSDGSFLLKVRWKNTAMIVSLTQICCPSDLKKKRTPTVYQNVTQYNKEQKHSHDSVTN
jgi:hypothetical protein